MGKSGRIWLTALLAVAMLASQVPTGLFVPGQAAGASGTISGFVRDVAGAPPPQGFQVRADNMDTFSIAYAPTNSDGFYQFSLPDGHYNIVFYPAGGPFQVYNDAASYLTATTITVAGDSHTGIDATLHGGTLVSGTVRNFDQSPAGGIDVTAYLGHDGNLGACCYFVGGATTAADGTYSFLVDSNISIKVRFAKDTFREQWYSNANNSTNDVVAGWNAAVELFLATPATNVDAQLGPNKPAISGRVFDNLENPLPQTLVEITDSAGGALEAVGLTNADGSYGFLVTSGKTYNVRFTPPAGSGLAIGYWQNKDDPSTKNGIAVTNANVGGVNAFLSRAYPVSGKVTDPAGGTIANVPVSVYLGTAGACCYFVRGASTNSDGQYSIDLAPGLDYRLVFAQGTVQETWWNGHANPGQDVLTGWTSADAFQVTASAPGHPGTDGVLQPTAGISGVARCGDLVGDTAVLRSGSTIVGTLGGLVGGHLFFAGTAPNSQYSLTYAGNFYPFGPFKCVASVTTDAGGNAQAPAGAGSPPDLGNHTWTTATYLPQLIPIEGGNQVAVFEQIDYIPVSGRSDWYKIHIAPGEKVLIKLTGTGGTIPLPADFSLALFKDIRAYLDQEKAAVGGSDPLTAVQNHDAATAPDALSPDALSPDALSPDALSPDALSPDALSPDALSPDALSPDELSPDELSPDALSPDAYSPDALSPDALSPDAYSGAQTATILRISAHQGTSPEQIVQNTWSNTGDFYIRVRGHNGAFAASDGFTVTAEITSTACTGVTLLPAVATAGPVATPKTLILTNTARFGVAGVATNYATTLATFAGRLDVGGLVIDLASNVGLTQAYTQWDANPTCPTAANVVADAIKKLVDQYRPTLKYVVIAGGDHVVPYYRTPDQAGLGNESGFQPGLFQDTASQASLAFGYTLTQDSYGTLNPIAHFDHSFYMPDLPVGRLVESSTDIISVLDAYTAANGIVKVAGGRALDSGYDFLADTATFVQSSLSPSMTVDPLIQQRGQAPWTADQLRSLLFARHYGIVSLNGHFSANTLLASDFATRITSDEVAPFSSLFTNTLVISTGCHSGYNIVDSEALPNTKSVDWTQALARAGAEVIGSTGYGYGDTDFMKYTELIVANFTDELRYDSGAIAIGTALVNAKHSYVGSLPALRGIDEKALMEATLYGLPMWSIDLGTSGRLQRPGTASGIVPTPTGITGLSTATVAPAYTLNRHPASGNGGTGVYYDANGNVAVAPSTPVLPLTSRNVGVAGNNARGAVLMDASYTDEGPVTPFTDVAGTELAGLHSGFASPVFTPVRPFALNSLSGLTTFITTPAQFKTTGANSGTLRRWTSESFQLFYSSRTDLAAALAGSPVVYSVRSLPGAGGAVRFEVTVGAVADPAFAGAYLTYTAEHGPQYGTWHSVAMAQTGGDLITGAGITRTYAVEITPGAGATAEDLRAFVQVVGGNGLVSMNTNNGAYYRFEPDVATSGSPKLTTALAITAPSHAAYLSSTTVHATLTGPGGGLAGLPVTLTLGSQRADVLTDATGIATATFSVTTAPGLTTITAGFAEDPADLASGAAVPFTVDRAAATLTGGAVNVQYSDSAVIATLRLGGASDSQSVTLAANGTTIPALSDALGRIRLDTRDLLALGANSVVVAFTGSNRFTGATLTVPVTVTAEDATLTLAAPATHTTGPVTATAQVAQATDGSLGDLTKAKVTFALRNEANAIETTIVGAVSATGGSTATFASLGSGVYRIEATVTGGYFSSPLVSTPAIVYNPASYTYGTGSLNTTTTSTGLPSGKKAVFAFATKYLSGQTRPTGGLEVNVDKTFNFLALPTFDWLAVANGRAVAQGSGWVNKTAGYSFRLIVVDAHPDTFELRIWNTATNPTSSFDAPLYKLSGAITSGDIVVH